MSINGRAAVRNTQPLPFPARTSKTAAAKIFLFSKARQVSIQNLFGDSSKGLECVIAWSGAIKTALVQARRDSVRSGKSQPTKNGRFSAHARQRARQRGVQSADLALLLFGADREASVGGGCVARFISRNCRRELLAEGYPSSIVDRAVRITVVESRDGEIMTVLRTLGLRGKKYRKTFRTRRRKST